MLDIVPNISLIHNTYYLSYLPNGIIHKPLHSLLKKGSTCKAIVGKTRLTKLRHCPLIGNTQLIKLRHCPLIDNTRLLKFRHCPLIGNTRLIKLRHCPFIAMNGEYRSVTIDNAPTLHSSPIVEIIGAWSFRRELYCIFSFAGVNRRFYGHKLSLPSNAQRS